MSRLNIVKTNCMICFLILTCITPYAIAQIYPIDIDQMIQDQIQTIPFSSYQRSDFFSTEVCMYYISTDGNDETGDGSFYYPWRTIQHGIECISCGDILYVLPGVYNEHIHVYKEITLFGSDRNLTILNGSLEDSIIDITENNVIVSGFTIKNMEHDNLQGISLLNVQNCIINNNIFSNHSKGIVIQDSNNNIICNNIVQSNMENGIYLKNSHNNRITNNLIKLNNLSGIVLLYSTENMIDNNTVFNNCFTASNNAGVILSNADSNTLILNTISHNYRGISLVSSNYNDISNNTLSNHFYGIHVKISSNDNDIYENYIHKNYYGVNIEEEANGNILQYNELQHNIQAVALFSQISGILYNNFRLNCKDIIEDVETSYSVFYSNQFIHNSNSRMIQFNEGTQILSEGDIVFFNISLFNAGGEAYFGENYEISTRPIEDIVVNKTENYVNGHFVCSASGMYALVVMFTDDNNNEVLGKQTFFVNATGIDSVTYYLRDVNPTHGQPLNPPLHRDAKAMIFTQPQQQEWWKCSEWIQNSPDEPHNLFPYSYIKDISICCWYKTETPGNLGIQRYVSFDKEMDIDMEIGRALDYQWIEKTFPAINWTMDYVSNWYWFAVKLKGRHPYWMTYPEQPSYVHINYMYPKNPTVFYPSDNRSIIISATSSRENPNNYVLYFEGEGSIHIQLQVPLSSSSYTIALDTTMETGRSVYMPVDGILDIDLDLDDSEQKEHMIVIEEIL